MVFSNCRHINCSKNSLKPAPFHCDPGCSLIVFTAFALVVTLHESVSLPQRRQKGKTYTLMWLASGIITLLCWRAVLETATTGHRLCKDARQLTARVWLIPTQSQSDPKPSHISRTRLDFARTYKTWWCLELCLGLLHINDSAPSLQLQG
jgi:hypothetical protein